MRSELTIYQVRPGDEYDRFRNQSYPELLKAHTLPDLKHYEIIYSTQLQKPVSPYKIYKQYIDNPPEYYSGEPIKTGDIFILRTDGILEAYYVDMDTLIALPGLYHGRHEKKAVEKDVNDYEIERAEIQANTQKAKKDSPHSKPQARVSIQAQLQANEATMTRREEERKQAHDYKKSEKNKARESGLSI